MADTVVDNCPRCGERIPKTITVEAKIRNYGATIFKGDTLRIEVSETDPPIVTLKGGDTLDIKFK